MNNTLIMEFRNPVKCIFQDAFCRREGQVLLGQAEEMAGKARENEHGAFWDSFLDEADVFGSVASLVIDVLQKLELELRDMF